MISGWIRAGCVTTIVVVPVFPDFANATDAVVQDGVVEKVRIYKIREERRDAGVKRKLTDWLTASGLAEVEYDLQRFSHNDSPSHSQEYDFSKSGSGQATRVEY